MLRHNLFYCIYVVIFNAQSIRMFNGSPRDLSLHTDIKDLAEKLTPIPDCQLFFKMFMHRKLLRAQTYLADNAPVGRLVPFIMLHILH